MTNRSIDPSVFPCVVSHSNIIPTFFICLSILLYIVTTHIALTSCRKLSIARHARRGYFLLLFRRKLITRTIIHISSNLSQLSVIRHPIKTTTATKMPMRWSLRNAYSFFITHYCCVQYLCTVLASFFYNPLDIFQCDRAGKDVDAKALWAFL